MEDDKILASEILAYKSLPRQAAMAVMDRALAKAEIKSSQIAYCLSTGFGKKAVPHADRDIPELLCLSRAVHQLNPDIRTVIDAGGQSIKAFNINPQGKVTASTANEKCASGTGKFMEVMAHALEVPIDRLSQASLQSVNPLPITSQCGVFAESEVITHVNEGRDSFDIFAGISLSVASKVSGVVRRISVNEPLALLGGVAKNLIVVRDIEAELKISLIDPQMDPQIVAAYGAALLAKERAPK
jgi:predicted CoA-substrate-specific enzyme activase